MKRTLFLCLVLAGLIAVSAVPFAVQAAENPGYQDFESAPADKDPCRDDQGNEICPFYIPFDTRVNSLDPMAPMTAYCRSDQSIEVWSIVNNQGQALYTASGAELSAGLVNATRRGADALIRQMNGYQLLATPSAHLKIAVGAYAFEFAAQVCGIEPPAANATNNTPNTNTTDPVQVNPVGNPDNTTQPITPGVTVDPATLRFVGTTTTTDGVNFRVLPALTARRIGGIPFNTTVSILGRNTTGAWLKVYFNEQVGWISSRYTQLAQAQLALLPIVR
jgi:hypothetical protein